MRSLVAVAAALEVVAVVDARGPYKWSQDRHVREWRPAKETPGLGYMPLLGMLSPPPPAPTTPPVFQPRMLEIRATDNTCAYISGKADSSLYCDTGSACVYNSGNSHIGCCPESNVKCPVFTSCLDATQSSLFTSNNGFTLLCTSSEYPFCLKHVFGDDAYLGYTLLGCGRTAGSDLVFFSATTTTTSSSSSTTSSSSSSSSTSSSSHSQTTTTLPPQTPTNSPDSGSSSPPIAPIVGGAVGGVAALGLIGLGAAFLMRRSRKPPPSPSPASPQPPAPGPPGQSILGPNGPQEMAQQHHYPQGYAAVPAADAAAAVAPTKAQDPYNPSSFYDPDPHQQQQQQQRMSVQTVSPQTSPPIQQPQGQVQWAVPAQPQPQQPYQVAQPQYAQPQYAQPYQVAQPDGQPYQVAQPQQQPGMGYQSGPVAGTYQAAELDARPETQLRELPS